MHRTFPAHEYFKDMGGVGQDALYKLNKAYSVHDSEVGYCQGLSFLVAALLLHVSMFSLLLFFLICEYIYYLAVIIY